MLPSGLGPGNGEVMAPLTGEFRLESDFALARDARTACTWQSFVSNQALMAQSFAKAMTKMALLGQNPRALVDCTEVIQPAPPTARGATLPAGKTRRDIEASVSGTQ